MSLFLLALALCAQQLLAVPVQQSLDSERLGALTRSRALVTEHNAAFERGEVSFRLAENHLAHLTEREYKQRLGLRATERPSNKVVKLSAIVGNQSVPDAVDWRKKGLVTEVKDQGQCGSCWAFSTTGSLGGAHAKATGKLVSLSEQNLVDCSSENSVHEHGLMDVAFDYIEENGGIDTERSYPYRGYEQYRCKYSKRNVGATMASYVDLPSGDEQELKIAVATQGPISVAIDASSDSFQLYESGVYKDKQCGNRRSNLDHGVLLVGYGTDPKHGDYWIVKNSWSAAWGEKGYIRMARNNRNMCGIATMASYPQV
uniref:Cathepsin L-like n=1 Tax=Radopholus similis TaxID=46012 RepID=B5LBI1_RADSI|nr:cathepsin S-like cysteine proteinase [Radopholus similis]